MRLLEKMQIFRDAYCSVYPCKPTDNCTVLCCSVAEHETKCGDCWGECGNWGAIQRRRFVGDERPQDQFEILKGDSDPAKGKYRAWFWQFPKGVVYPPYGLAWHTAGARMLIDVLLRKRPSIEKVINTASPMQLAELMYNSKYYQGFHDPRQPNGRMLNIQDYGNALIKKAALFSSALRGEQVVEVVEAQKKLNELGYRPPLMVDGIMGPKTLLAIKWFQSHNGLKVDGILGPKTWEKLKYEVDGPPTVRNLP